MLSRLSPYWLWVVLSIPPMIWILIAITSNDPEILEDLSGPTGEWAARLTMITLAASPLMLLFKGRAFPRWLRKNRRYFGLAAFGYATLHLAFYVLDTGSVAKMLGDLGKIYILLGWLAILVFAVLAITSNDWSMRKLGPKWKSLQRLTYLAAILALVHWMAIDKWDEPGEAIMQALPLIGLEAYRIWYWYLRPSRRRRATA